MTINIIELYDTGTVKLYECNGIQFGWSDWVLCDVMHNSSNPPHRVICTQFRQRNNELGPVTKLIFSLWNSTYEPEHQESVHLDRLYYWNPIEVIQKESQKTWKELQSNETN